jgi:hypothetical protein
MSLLNALARQCVEVRQNALEALVCQCVSAYIEIRTRTTHTRGEGIISTRRTGTHQAESAAICVSRHLQRSERTRSQAEHGKAATLALAEGTGA